MEREMIEVRVNCEFEALVCLPGDTPQSWFQTARCIVHDTVEISIYNDMVSVGSYRALGNRIHETLGANAAIPAQS